MATERQLQFRVGALVIVATSICVGLAIRFGDTQSLWKRHYPLTIHLENGAGLYPSAPVTLSGLTIGSVRRVELNQTRGGVNVQVEVQESIRLPIDSRAIISRSLMGESTVDFIRGTDPDLLKPGGHLVGIAAADPLVMVQRLEARTLETLSAFSETSQEWGSVAKNINMLLDTERGHLDQVVERAAESLHEFTRAMQSANAMISAANQIVADPASQQAIKETLNSLPKLVNTTRTAIDETRQTVVASRQVLDSMNRNLVNLSQVTEPVGKRGEEMVAKLDSSLTNIDSLLTELNRFARVVNQKDGSLQKLVQDPSLYDNLDRSSQSIAVLMKNLEPILRDMREFSDKVARNPELLGVGGAVRPSTGLKDEEILDAKRTAVPKVARGKSPR
ncbi:MlaD family protein [Schlesneria paludicola]|uniref:MlaD family protein n=1 Tax=Schlesneria paludicola TaxID=360056 RepID=UPI00029A46CE|nr:MlaD family protein [Schlesneria paludicola]